MGFTLIDTMSIKKSCEAMKNENKTMDEVAADVIRQFNESFRLHDISMLNNIVAENCVMEAAMPAPKEI